MIQLRMDLAEQPIGVNKRDTLATVNVGHFLKEGTKKSAAKNKVLQEIVNMCIQCIVHFCTDCFKP